MKPSVWKSFDVVKETQQYATQRKHLLDDSDRILFNNDPTLTPKRTRDGKIDHALSRKPQPKTHHTDDATAATATTTTTATATATATCGHVEVPYRRIVHELFAEDTNHVDARVREIGMEPSARTPKKWGTPLSRHQVDAMTMEEIDANHKRLLCQNNLDYATGMARKNGTRVIEQLIVEDRKRADNKALRDKWLEHRRRLKSVAQPRIEEHGKSKQSKQRQHGTKKTTHTNQDNHKNTTEKSTRSNQTRQPVTMLGADESKPIYGLRQVEDIDAIIEQSKKRGGLKMMGMDPAAVVLRCASIRKNSAEDLMSLQAGLDAFLKDELEWEEKRHDMKYVLNSRFDILKKEIDHSVSVGGSDYRYDNQFIIDEEDRQALHRIKTSVKARRKKALHHAETVRKKTREHILDRRMDQTRLRLGLRPKGLVSGSDYDSAAAQVLAPKTGDKTISRYK